MIGRAARTTLTRHAPAFRSQVRHGGGGLDTYVIAGREFNTVHVVLGILGFYGSLIFLGTRGGKKKEEEETPAPVAAASEASTEIVSILDENFDAWSKEPGNMEKWVKSLEDVDSWTKSL